ncbi:hypothetical protein IFM89_029651, partial [Coptis chinensis]
FISFSPSMHSFEITDSADDERSQLNDTQRSWLLRPQPKKIKKYVDLGFIVCSYKALLWTIAAILFAFLLIALPIILSKNLPNKKDHPLPPDDYSKALHTALRFFNAQKSGRLPKDNNVSWRGDSGLRDGLVGGYYDAGDNSKLHFPLAFSMTMLSWSVIEYSTKYKAVGEYDHVKELIKWGTDYLLLTFNSSATTIDQIYSQYERQVQISTQGPDLAGEMAAALAAASIVFRDDVKYSKKLLDGATALYKFADDPSKRLSYSRGNSNIARYYNSTGYWDEIIWSAAWMFYASELLLTRLRIFLGPGYPYEGLLRRYHNEAGSNVCSYLRQFNVFNWTKGGLILLNHGRPLQYVANAAFLASLFADYMNATGVPGWYCGPNFISSDKLRFFASSQVNYILGANPMNMSYLVGYGDKFPKYVYHRGASIRRPSNNTKNEKVYTCHGGWAWFDSAKPNPNEITGAMVGGPYKSDKFEDDRKDRSHTEPTLAGNAGLVAALVSLTTSGGMGIDRNTIFWNVSPFYPSSPPPPPPWQP